MNLRTSLYTLGLFVILLFVVTLPVASQTPQNGTISQGSSEESKKLAEYKVSLVQLENKLALKKVDAINARKKAAESAKQNDEAAAKLQRNPEDKKLAQEARKAANLAQRNARSARKTEEQLPAIQQDILSLKSQIESIERQASITYIIPQKSDPTPSPVQNGANDTPANLPSNSKEISNNQANESHLSSSKVKELTEKIISSTQTSQQTGGTPSIIINNIIVPSEYASQSTDRSTNRLSANELKDYEEFKAWQLERKRLNSQREIIQGQTNVSSNNNVFSKTSPSAEKNLLETFKERPTRNSGLWVIPSVGIHASDFDADIKEEEANGRSGWNAGLDFRIRTGRFFVQPGVHYFNSSIEFTNKDSLSNAPLLSGPRIHSLKVPLTLGLYLTKANSGFFKINIKGGGVANYVLAVDKNELQQFSKDNIEDLYYGLNAGIGFEFGLLTLDLGHEWGMSRLFKDSKSKNNVLSVTLGVKL